MKTTLRMTRTVIMTMPMWITMMGTNESDGFSVSNAGGPRPRQEPSALIH